ncbi:chaplin family protein [Actinomadura opuntiae]|uniref:chaplin family protein n=1 Tax=Actinomadura sp. OS1-43 TaxID=604315 RepID=UPI00255AB701|nr:chaplin family protein [Actinomadura sp. OS1-43]MDL4815366.1 chaplin family protein [Actinomadura sp. OS1-43]
MRIWARNTGRAALVAAGCVAMGATGLGAPASADTTTSGDLSILGGNQVVAPISIPVEASGNAVGAVAGIAQAGSKGGSAVQRRGREGGDMHTSGNMSIGGGNQVYAPISVPIDVCGNAVGAVLGIARAGCEGGAAVIKKDGGKSHSGWRAAGRTASPGESQAAPDAGTADNGRMGWGGGGGWGGGSGGHGMQTSGNMSILGGNQVYAPISVPVNVCGNAISLIAGITQAGCKGGAVVVRKGDDRPDMKTSGNMSILGGNQVYAPISVPINVCGNAIGAVLGIAQAGCKGGAAVITDGGHKHHKHHKLPKTLRTPKKPHKKKHYKPAKHRPAAGHHKLPSTLRGSSERIAMGPDYRSAEGMPAVQELLGKVTRVAKPVASVTPGKADAQLPQGNEVPVKLGTPLTN